MLLSWWANFAGVSVAWDTIVRTTIMALPFDYRDLPSIGENAGERQQSGAGIGAFVVAILLLRRRKVLTDLPGFPPRNFGIGIQASAMVGWLLCLTRRPHPWKSHSA